ncbi:MAG: hypothetical protein R3D55_13845 [Chloroflexota bacterium]
MSQTAVLSATPRDIYISSDLTDITGIYLGSEGLIKRKHFLITRSDVVVFGIDAILVRTSEVVAEESSLPESVALDSPEQAQQARN